MAKKTVYMDLDGVLADFTRKFYEDFILLCGDAYVEPTEWDFYKKHCYTDIGFAKELNKLTSHWWATIEPTREFEMIYKQMLELQKLGYSVELLTHAVGDEAIEGKKQWVQKHMPKFYHTMHFVRSGKEKAEYAHKHAILIDDSIDNIEAFLEGGGEAMLFGRPWNDKHYGAIEILNCWYVDGRTPKFTEWVTIALGVAVEPEPDVLPYVMEMQEMPRADYLEAINAADKILDEMLDSFGYSIDDEDSCFEIPEIAPAGVMVKFAEQPKLDYSAMDSKEYRKNTPLCSGCLYYFPDALELVAQNSMVGHVQHNDASAPMYWDRSKSADEPDAMVRHLVDHHKNPIDDDGTLHLSKVAWRALAMLQKFLEENPNWRQRNAD